MRNSKAPSPRHGGIAAILLVLFLLLAVGGGGFYYLKEANKETYANETQQLAAATSQAIRQLSGRSSQDDLQRIRKKIEVYQTRTDATRTAIDTWTEQIESIEAKLEKRDLQTETIRQRISEFDSNATVAELETFDVEIKNFTKELDQTTRNKLLVAWSQKKNQIMAEIQSVSATVIAKTFPSGAKTYLDGEYIGLSSLGIQNVRKGKHLLTFEKDGYLDAQLEVLVTKSEQIEPPVIELQLAVNPVHVTVTGGSKRAKISISIEKTADNNDNIILYIDEQTGRDLTFEKAPLGRLYISVTADSRLAAEQIIENKTDQDTTVLLDLDQ